MSKPQNDLVPSDYCLVYSCIVKYQSVLLDKRRTKSIHCLVDFDDSIPNNQANNQLRKSNSSLQSSSDCSCCAIHFSTGQANYFSKENHANLTSTSNPNSLYKATFSFTSTNRSPSASSPIDRPSNDNQNCSNRNQQDSFKTASTSTINSKLKNSSPNRLVSSASGHRMPNNNGHKNANHSNQHSSTNKINEKLQSVGVNQQQTSTTNSTKTTQPTRTITDHNTAIQLLAEDVESRLEALLRTFIQEEKLRQEMRYNSLMGKRSASLSALNSDYADAVNQQDALNITDHQPTTSRSVYSPQLNSKSSSIANKAANFGYVKPQQHRMQQSYQLHNSQNVNTSQQQKPTAIKTSSHRLDSLSSNRPTSVQSSSPNSKVVTRKRSPSPSSRPQSPSAIQTGSNLFPVNRNNKFGQHQRSEANQNKPVTTTSSKQPTTHLNLHQRSQSPTKEGSQLTTNKSQPQSQSSQLIKHHMPNNSQNQFLGYSSSHRLHSPSFNQNKFYNPFSTNSSQFGRVTKDDSHIRRVVIYNLNKDAASVEKKPVIIEQAGSKSMNGTLNNGYTSNVTASSPEKANDNQAIRLRSAKTRANSPSRGGMLNGSNIASSKTNHNAVGHQNLQSTNLVKQQQQQANSLAAAGRLVANSSGGPANTASNNINSNKLSGSSPLNNSSITAKKLSSAGNKVTTNVTSNSRLKTTGHENTSSLQQQQQFKDHNNNLESNLLNVGVGSAAQLNATERKVVRKVIIKELDGPNQSSGSRNESVVNSSCINSSSLNNKPTATYQQQQRLSPISNGDLNSVPTMATLNTQQPVMTNSLSNSNQISSLDALLSERDRILNNRDQYKQLRSNVLSDANNNYLLSKNNKYASSNSDPTAAGLLSASTLSGDSVVNQSLAGRNLPLSSSAVKRKPLVDRYSPFSIVNEARQRWEDAVIKNGMNGQLPSRFDCLDKEHLACDDDLLIKHDDLVFHDEFYEHSEEEIVDSSMVLIRSRLSRMLNTNGDISSLPNSVVISLLNQLSDSNKKNEPPLPLPACLSDLNKYEILPPNASPNPITSTDNVQSLNSTSSATFSATTTGSSSSINSLRPPFVASSDSNGHSTPAGQSNGQNPTSQNRANSVKPFLSKGSVAERVLLFEKHPQLKQIEETEAANRKEENAITQRVYKSPLPYSSWREKSKNEVINLSTSFEQNLKGKPPLSKQQNLEDSLPKFYFPHGKPPASTQQIDQLTKQINQFFKTLKDAICTRDNLVELCKASNFPIFWKEPLFLMLAQNNQITHDSYLTFWRKLNASYFDEASRFVFILSKGKRNCLLPEDFIAIIQDVINTHPGLLFLKFANEFHSRYVHTVIARIYYTVNRSWSGRISIAELRKSNFLQTVKLLQDEDDINQITDYFSYEHFYVIYCKFWGLDRDHDLIIDKYDLSRHNDGAISSRMIDRIFSGAVTQSKSKSKQMTYQEFVFFLISEEDKKTDTAIEYFFRCLDLDGDGYLSLFELEYFYEEQVRRMESIGIEALPFTDCICQMLDMINPEHRNKISLSDLKKCSMTYIFLDTFFNLHKYLLHEQKDPFSSNKDDQLESDWNKYAAEEYNLLVAEEQNQINDENVNKQPQQQQKYITFMYDDDNEFRVNPYLQKEYDDYYDTTTDHEDYDYLLTDEESLY